MSFQTDFDAVLKAVTERYPNVEIITDNDDRDVMVAFYIEDLDVFIYAAQVLYNNQYLGAGWINSFKSDTIKSEGNKDAEWTYTGIQSVLDTLDYWVKKKLEDYIEYEQEMDDIDREWGCDQDSLGERQSNILCRMTNTEGVQKV